MRVPITVAPPAPIMLPVPQLPGGDPFDNDLFRLSPLHPSNRPLVDMLLKFPQTLLNPATGADQPNGSTECAGNCVFASKEEKDAESGKEIDPADKDGKLTRSGRAAQKHGSRPGSAFEPTKGNSTQINSQGQQTLEGIVSNPGRTLKNGNRFGGYDVFAPDGRGARFDNGGKFRGFLEP